MITIHVNTKEYLFKKPIHLNEVLEELDIQTSGIAVAINNTIISKQLWKKTQLMTEDKVLVIKAAQGG